MHQQQKGFENIMGKGEIARNEQFLLFPQCFPANQIILSSFVHIFDIASLFGAKFEKPTIGISGKGLIFMLQTPPFFFQCQKGPFYNTITLVMGQNEFLWIHNFVLIDCVLLNANSTIQSTKA